MRLLDGPPRVYGAEWLAAHEHRLGPRPRGGRALLDAVEAASLLGRGGAAFPVATKWRTVATARGRAVVLANGSEGEPLSRKDQEVMERRPHLVIDGALLAAETVGADRVVFYVGEDHPRAFDTMARAIGERRDAGRVRIELAAAPPGYVTGEESAAVNFVTNGVATPMAVPPRPFERGVDGRPTLVQNVESLAHAALIARGTPAVTVLLTISGAVREPGVYEVDAGTPVLDALAAAGSATAPLRAVLLGGYFGAWLEPSEAARLPLDAPSLRAARAALGCGVLHALPTSADPVAVTAGIMRVLANESAAQCGPCFFGLRALAEACEAVAGGGAGARELGLLRRWSDEVGGRGACRHPDGAVGFLRSALRVFASEFEVATGTVARSVA